MAVGAYVKSHADGRLGKLVVVEQGDDEFPFKVAFMDQFVMPSCDWFRRDGIQVLDGDQAAAAARGEAASTNEYEDSVSTATSFGKRAKWMWADSGIKLFGNSISQINPMRRSRLHSISKTVLQLQAFENSRACGHSTRPVQLTVYAYSEHGNVTEEFTCENAHAAAEQLRSLE